MIDYGKPVVTFYANMLHIGLKIKVVNGQLKVGGNTDLVTPVLQGEIVKRAEALVEMLKPPVPEPLQPYFGRLITVTEVIEVMGIAERLQVGIKTTPVNGGWLCLMGGEYERPKKGMRVGK